MTDTPKHGFKDLTPSVKLLSVEQAALYFIEQHWQQNGKWPSEDAIRAATDPGFSLADALKKQSFVNGLVNRGIDLPSLKNSSVPGTLSPTQIAAVASILNWDDKRSRATKLKELGVTPTRWQGWLKSKQFKEYLATVSGINFQDSVHAAHEGLMRGMDKGNTDAIKFYMEVTGRYEQTSQEAMNLKLVLSRLIEAIQRNVKDPKVLDAINRDFEVILSGGKGLAGDPVYNQQINVRQQIEAI